MGVIARRIEEKLSIKAKIVEELASKLDTSDKRAAERDSHAKRKPRPCGMTIHTGIGCNIGCLYCYVPDMGFPLKPRPYPLSGLQLVYALALNPYFVPGADGTLLAFGSVTEPFLPETKLKAFEYLQYTRDYLGNPQQLSTKLVLDDNDIDMFLKVIEPQMNLLLTVTTIKYASKLEPKAPPPPERFAFASELTRRGVHVTLFLRPLIPGVTDRELDNIYRFAVEAGIQTVVIGSLRVTPGILKRLAASRVVDISLIEERLPRKPRSGKDQVTIIESDLKKAAAKKAEEYGLKVLPSSCSANIYSHNLACMACKWGPCGDIKKLSPLDEDDVRDALVVLGCQKPIVRIRSSMLVFSCKRAEESFDPEKARLWLETITKRSARYLRRT